MLTLEEFSNLEGTVVIDVETTGLHWWKDGIIGLGFFHPSSGEVGYFHTNSWAEEPYGNPRKKKTKVWTGEYCISANGKKRKIYEEIETITQPTRAVSVPDLKKVQEIKAAVAKLAGNSKVKLLGHNLKFDAHFLGLDLWNISAAIGDTSVMVHLWDSRLKKSLADCERFFLGNQSKRNLVQEATLKSSQKLPKYWSDEAVKVYCQNDCIVTAQLEEVLMPKLEELDLIGLYNLQMRFLRLLSHIERVGILLDKENCMKSLEAFDQTLQQMQEDLQKQVGLEFNWRSNAQLSYALYDHMGFPRPENPFADEDGVDRTRFAHRGKYNKFATSSFLLMEKAQHPLGWLVMDLREADKLRKTVEKYLELADENNIIHASFKQTGTRTGRLSCSEPNLQNIASDHRVRETQSVYSGGGIRSEHYNLRRNFIARPGYKFVSLDHKQQEMRMFGILAEDPKMMEILASGTDVHLGVALMVWGDCGEERNALHREWSKTIGFGLIYGMTTGSLQFRLNKTAEEARALAEEYWKTFPRIQPFLRETIQHMHEYGYVRYWSGRIWREEEPNDFYKAANAQVQGGSADLMSLVAIRIQRMLDAYGWGNVISIIHDELLMEIRESVLEEAIPVLAKIMWAEDIFGLPFFCDLKIGDSYGTMEKGKLDNEVIAKIDWKEKLAQAPNKKKV
jgi:DNA polymerase-1